MAMRPGSDVRPSKRAVVLAFAGAIAAALALVAVAVLLRNDRSTPLANPNPVVNLAGIPQDGSFLGQQDAKVTLIEYADPQCPGCRSYTEIVFPVVVDEYVRPGRIRTEFRGFPFIGDDSVTAYRFLLAAGKQNRLWNLQEALYRHQGGENDGWVTDELIRELANRIPGLDVEQLFVDAERDDIRQAAENAAEEARNLGIPGTPSLLVQIGTMEPYYIQVRSADELRAALDDALQG
jgi:protein-disulfide isomerase